MDWTKQGGSMAEHYAKTLVPGMFEPCAEALLGAAGLESGNDVLDVACGTGVVSRMAAGRVGAGGSVVGVDMAPPMLAKASEAGGDVDYRHGDAQALPVDDESFDVAVCQHGLQFFPDKPAAVAEMVRALRPGGTVAIACWTRFDDSPSFVAMAAALGEHLGEEQAAAMRMPVSVGPDDLLGLLEGAGLDDVSVDVAEIRTDFHGTVTEMAAGAALASPLAGPIMDLPEPTRDSFIAQVAARMEPHADAGHVRPPLFTSIATAHKPG